jgi:hypothetical protein
VRLLELGRKSRTILLARTFFARFFESDLMPPGLPQVQLVIWSLALLASPGLLFPARFAGKYTLMRRGDPALLAHALLVDRLLFVTLTMTAIGVVALVIWDGVFPDRRDARILSVLPLPARVLIIGRLLALAALAGIFLTGMNAVPTIIYGPVVAAFGGAANVVFGAAAHFAATTLAGLFVFSTLIALQGIVLNVGGRRAADRLSVMLQIVFVMALLQMIFFLPRLGSVVQANLDAPWLRLMPAVWFLGVYEVVGGLPASGAAALATIAVAATALSTTAAVVLFVATHSRLIRLAIEARDAGSGAPVARVLQQATQRISRRPSSRAVLELTLRSLVRSRSHRLIVSMHLGVALALVVSALVPLAMRRGVAGFDQPSVEILSAPLVVMFFVLIGFRFAMAVPVEPRANWVVRLLEPGDRPLAINGVRTAMLLVGVLPPAVVAGVAAAALWGPFAGAKHLMFCISMGWLLVEILMLRLAKIPFTCTYYPGRSRVATFWPLYLTAFITYAYTAAAWEADIFTQATTFAQTLLAITIAIVVLTQLRRHNLRSIPGFRFVEEDPTMIFEGFNLSEGFAAASEEARKLR